MLYRTTFLKFRLNKKFIARCFSSRVNLRVSPLKCLHDEPIHITAANLPTKSNVTLTSTIEDDKGNTFLTYTHYRSDENGTIDLSTHPSLDGTYKGLFPMGPIAALKPAPHVFKYQRYMKRNITTPLIVNFNLIKGHVNVEEAMNPNPDIILDSIRHERIYMTENTTRIPVREGRIRGTLFIPEGEGPFPGVIDLFGTAGGLLEYRSAQFAARGIASLTLAYFGFEDLPKELEVLDLSYFEEALDYLLSHPKVKNDHAGAIGVSKGGDIVCSMGTFLPKIKAVACINGLPVNTMCPLEYKDIVIPGLTFRIEKAKMLEPGLVSSYEMMDDSEDFPETHIPLHESKAEFLFVCGEEDANWKTVIETEKAAQRMKAKGKTDFEVLKYKGTGHLIEPAYAPFSQSTFHKFASAALFWGGEPLPHSKAQVDSWEKILQFFKRVLV